MAPVLIENDAGADLEPESVSMPSNQLRHDATIAIKEAGYVGTDFVWQIRLPSALPSDSSGVRSGFTDISRIYCTTFL